MMNPGSHMSALSWCARGLLAFAAVLWLVAPGVAQAQEGASPFTCFQLLQERGRVDENTATQLCQGARSLAPAQCFVRMQDTVGLSAPQALQLCQYAAPEDDPAGCFLEAQEQTFLEDWRIIQLCKPSVSELMRYCPNYF